MSQRVLATQAAERAARRMQGLLRGDVRTQVAAVDQQGRTLSMPSVWDGPDAVRFRTQQWPQASRALDRAVAALTTLDRWAERAIDDIIRAGSEGAVGAPGVPGAGVPSFGQDMWNALRGYFLPPTALGPAGVSMWATRRGLTVFGGFADWMTSVRLGHFVSRGLVPLPGDVPWWQRGLKSLSSKDWIAKPGMEDSFSAWTRAGEWGGRAGGVLAIGTAALAQWVQDSGNSQLDTGARIGRTAYAGLVTGGATWGGTIAGTELGGAIGTAIFPGVGTVVGGLIGGIAGAVVGSGVGSFVASHTVDAVGNAVDAVGHDIGSLGGGALHALESLNPF